MSRIDICCKSCHLKTKTVAHRLTVLQGTNNCAQYLASHPHKPILYPSEYYYGSNFIILTWSGNQVEDCTTHNYMEYHPD